MFASLGTPFPDLDNGPLNYFAYDNRLSNMGPMEFDKSENG